MQLKLPVTRRSVEDLDLLVILGECDLRGVGVPGVRRDGGHAKGEGCLRASHGCVCGIILKVFKQNFTNSTYTPVNVPQFVDRGLVSLHDLRG